MRRALTEVARLRHAVTARSPSLLSMALMLIPNDFNLKLDISILRRINRVNRLMDKTAAAGEARHLTISALQHILSPLQAEQS
ncbi:hypothetical protein [Lonsdalea quercina]|uniref:hypothetical protein n=1 Tax=Lonsdalea quercina TaxID=71657 RepID=UPI0039754E7F